MKNLFKTEALKLDVFKNGTLSDFLSYKVHGDRTFRFSEFNKVCGMSRQQWDLFKSQNKELKDIKWIIE